MATRIEDAAELAPGALTRMSGMARASLRSPRSSARILAAADVTSSRRLMVYSLLTCSPASVAASRCAEGATRAEGVDRLSDPDGADSSSPALAHGFVLAHVRLAKKGGDAHPELEVIASRAFDLLLQLPQSAFGARPRRPPLFSRMAIATESANAG